MSSISLSLKMMLAASACAGLTLLACGGDDSGGGGNNSDDDDSTASKDAGKGKDAGKDAGKVKDAGLAIEMVTPGDECDPDVNMGLGGSCEDCDKAPCFSRCEDGVYGECKSSTDLIGELTKDGGLDAILRDSGFSLPDTGIKVTDGGGLSLPTGDGGSLSVPTQTCPADFTCDSSLSTLGLPATCVKPGDNTVVVFELPPKCTTNDDCKKLGLTGTCLKIPAMGLIPAGSDQVCVSPCK